MAPTEHGDPGVMQPAAAGRMPLGDATARLQAETGARLAAFAIGCLGAGTPSKAGSKLGIMGSASEEEFAHVLRHLEALAGRRAAKLAGTGPIANPVTDTSSTASGCSLPFEAAICEACGEAGGGAAGLFARMPRDGSGRADLLAVFGMASASKSSASPAGTNATASTSEGNTGGDFPADYVESAGDLPRATEEDRLSAEQHLVREEAAEASWAADLSAVNKIRSALVHAALGATPAAPTSELITAVSRRCASRRPALAKSALGA
eukprot:CAMPEP_0204593240 /NCGR_PEP_ID=MMETSP0661-20131031/51395_1 /ASSEMBLY_ACC=CAM_ASM_000606 /TAXON_ID=109239 /ORGANISM="Alexandrium margalefi, Strain AMGDE01CS-322" /LENGTH=264 /DNA_ID=CAMNT_0051603535 /DNA_START=1 /DNA_END=791 /DNA_ORIENTATION=+